MDRGLQHKQAWHLDTHGPDADRGRLPCAKALDDYPQGRLVLCCDEKTGRQVLERQAPTQTIGRTRTATDFVAHLQQAYQRLPRMTRYAGVLDNFNTHWSLDVCRLVARWCQVPFEPHKLKKGPQRLAFLSDPSHRHVFHFTPKHDSWLNQAAWFFGVLPRRFLARGSFPSAKDFARRLERFLKDDNARHAHPSRWTYTGEP